MSSIPTMYSRSEDGTISGVTFILGTQPYMADASLPSFSELLDELKKGTPDEARLVALTEPATAIIDAVAAAEEADYLPKGKVSVTRSEVRYDGEQVEGVLVDRILQMLAEGFDIMPMVRFLENLYTNPATYAREELYLWLENNNLPITEDGYFLAYKKVNGNFTSVHDSRTDNTPGKVVSMQRSAVDTVRDHTCSTGLHFCSREYLPHFGGSTIVMLKINPADVVSIPSDYNNAKGRAWQYLVLSKIEDDPQTKVWPSVVDEDGNEFEDDDDWDQDDPGLDGSLEIPSELAGALFAAYSEIAEDPKDRDARIDWANDFFGWDAIDSFSDLSQSDASDLIEYAREIKAERDEDAEEEVAHAQANADAAVAAAKQAKIDAINGYGIITLRQKTGKWKGYKAQELRDLLIAGV